MRRLNIRIHVEFVIEILSIYWVGNLVVNNILVILLSCFIILVVLFHTVLNL
jgi:hypothetical protein